MPTPDRDLELHEAYERQWDEEHHVPVIDAHDQPS